MGMLHSKIDLKKLAEDCKKRGYDLTQALSDFDNYKKNLLLYEEMLAESKRLNKNNDNIEKSKELKLQIKQQKNIVNKLKDIINKHNLKIPNYLHKSVPIGKDEKDNLIVKECGKFYWNGLNHYNMPGFQVSSAGSRWVQLDGVLCKVARNLINIALKHLEEAGFHEYYLPQMFPQSHFKQTGHFGDPDQTLFLVPGANEDKALIPTSEVSLLSVIPKVIDKTVKICSYSLCFRKEAGSAGKDWKGLIRNHQFMKVEMVAGCLPEKSEEVHDFLVKTASSLLTKLGINHRIVQLCTGDIGDGAYKTYDIEAPIGGLWREIASISNCHVRQSIGLKIKTPNKEFAHLLNGTCLAIDRVLAVLMEKHYDVNTKTYKFPDFLVN